LAHAAVKFSSLQTIAEILDYLEKNKVENTVYEEDDKQGSSTDPKQLSVAVLLETNSNNLTAFEHAVAKGASDIIKLYMERGGVELPKEEQEEYEG